MKKIRALFFGTPQLSADILTDLLTSKILDIIAIVSNPDTAGGRGHALIQSPVTLLAKEKNIPLLQPEKVKNNPAFLESIKALKPDICLVVAYGKILPQELLDIPPMGFLNVHTSLLPKYRGAAPIQHALLNGEKITSLTVQQMSLGMDEGDILIQESWEIGEADTTGTLFEKTGQRGGPLLIKAINGLLDGTITPQKQDGTQATYTKYIKKTDAEIQSDWTIDHAYRAWQAYTPWPGLYTFFGETKVTLHRVEKCINLPPDTCLSGQKTEGAKDMLPNSPLFMSQRSAVVEERNSENKIEGVHPGGTPPTPSQARGSQKQTQPPTSLTTYIPNHLCAMNGLPALALSDGYLLIHSLTPAGKKRMSGEDFVRGYMTQ